VPLFRIDALRPRAKTARFPPDDRSTAGKLIVEPDFIIGRSSSLTKLTSVRACYSHCIGQAVKAIRPAGDLKR